MYFMNLKYEFRRTWRRRTAANAWCVEGLHAFAVSSDSAPIDASAPIAGVYSQRTGMIDITKRAAIE